MQAVGNEACSPIDKTPNNNNNNYYYYNNKIEGVSRERVSE